MQRQTAAYIDLTALRDNFALALSLAPAAKGLAVIKADAYGHGILKVAEALEDIAPMFGVATVDEAIALRDGGIKNAILVLEGIMSPDAAEEASSRDIVTMVHSPEQLALLRDTPMPAWIKVDTGMHRLGVPVADLEDTLRSLRDCAVDVQAVCTHLACAEELDKPMTSQQIDAFRSCTQRLDLPLSIANSAALIAWPESHADWVRPGLMVYGVSPFLQDVEAVRALRPAMSFVSEVIALRDIPAGDSVGYGARWTAERESRIATVAAGYADGYPRQAPNGTPVFLAGRIAPLVGTVSMDMITIDVTDHQGVAVGDAVELWGKHIAVGDIAERAGRISYELLTGVTPRVPRIYRADA